MFKFVSPDTGKEYKVTFQHVERKPINTMTLSHHNEILIRRHFQTIAHIVLSNGAVYSAAGCRRPKLNREEMRREALKDALRHFSRAERTAAWNAYWKAKEPPYHEIIYTQRIPRYDKPNQIPKGILAIIKLKIYRFLMRMFPIAADSVIKIEHARVKR